MKLKTDSEKDRRLMQREFEAQVRRLDEIRDELVQRELGLTAYARDEQKRAESATAAAKAELLYVAGVGQRVQSSSAAGGEKRAFCCLLVTTVCPHVPRWNRELEHRKSTLTLELVVLGDEHAQLAKEVASRQRALEIIADKTHALLEQQGLVDSLKAMQDMRLDLSVQLEEMEAMRADAVVALTAAKVWGRAGRRWRWLLWGLGSWWC